MNPISAKQLQKSKQNISLIKKTVLQIQKDFQLFEEEINFSGTAETAYQELYKQILPTIDRMLNLDSERFFSLLYAIDINENIIKELLFGNNDKNPSEEITYLILERELLKVVSRKYFSDLHKS